MMDVVTVTAAWIHNAHVGLNNEEAEVRLSAQSCGRIYIQDRVDVNICTWFTKQVVLQYKQIVMSQKCTSFFWAIGAYVGLILDLLWLICYEQKAEAKRMPLAQGRLSNFQFEQTFFVPGRGGFVEWLLTRHLSRTQVWNNLSCSRVFSQSVTANWK